MVGQTRLAKNKAPDGRNSLAQHEAKDGMLGKVGNEFESRRDGRVPFISPPFIRFTCHFPSISG
jgi:hypothetical protein